MFSANFTPITLILLFLGIFLIVALPKRLVLPVLLFSIFIIPEPQRVIIAGFDFNAMRILTPIVFLRLIARGELKPVKFHSIDIVFILWVIIGLTTYTLRNGTVSAFIYQLGKVYTLILLYFLVKQLMDSWKDVIYITGALTLTCVIFSIAMLMEQYLKTNYFSLLGSSGYLFIRDGRIRSWASFSHPILAGSFGATLAPVFIAYGFQKHSLSKIIATIGLAACVVMTITSASSGPVFSLIGGLFAFALWPVRHRMRRLRWGILMIVILLQISMKANVWFLIDRIGGVVSGSTAWHRSILIDRTIANFSDWWLMGSTNLWGHGLMDSTNYFVRIARDGGLFPLLLFIGVLAYSFQAYGQTVRLLENKSFRVQLLFWALGSSLFGHVTTFLGVAYFDQTLYLLLLLFAISSVLREQMPSQTQLMLSKIQSLIQNKMRRQRLAVNR